MTSDGAPPTASPGGDRPRVWTAGLLWLAWLFATLHFVAYKIDSKLGPYEPQSPRDAEYAQALLDHGLIEEAREVLENLARSRFLTLDRRAQVEMSLGELYETRLGRPDRAHACYLHATFLAPDSPAAREAGRRIHRIRNRPGGAPATPGVAPSGTPPALPAPSP